MITEEIFKRWQSGDQTARDEAWGALWNDFFGYALKLCDSDEDAAVDVLEDAIMKKIEKAITNPEFKWKGAAAFGRYVKTTILNSLRDRERQHRILDSLFDPVSPDKEEGEQKIDQLRDESALTPEDMFFLKEKIKSLSEYFRQESDHLSSTLRKILDTLREVIEETNETKTHRIRKMARERLGLSDEAMRIGRMRLRDHLGELGDDDS